MQPKTPRYSASSMRAPGHAPSAARGAERWTPILWILAFALALGLLESISLRAYRQRLGPAPITWGRALLGTLPSWLVVAALVWPVRLLARAAPLRPRAWLRHLPIHTAASALFVAASTAGTALAYGRLGLLGSEPFHAAFVRIGYTYLAYSFLTYWAIAGAWHALDYHAESERRERARAALAASLTEARLQALKAQIDPHFLFNTLNAISTFALQGKPDQVAGMVASLGDLMRLCMNDALPHEVPLARELEFLDLYLDIQRVRFPDWLRVEQEVSPEARDVLVPSMILQPLMENAIVHGAGDASGLDRVRLRCALENGHLTIEIRNPAPASGSEHGSGNGVGLRNTRERLAQIHPGRHEFASHATEGGWRVMLRVPARREGSASGAGAAP